MDSMEQTRWQDELTKIRESIDHVLAGKFVKFCLFNLYGMTGMGKTTSLHALARTYHAAPPAQAGIVLLDFSRPAWASDVPLHDLARYVWQQLRPLAPAHLQHSPNDQDTTEQAIASLIDWLNTSGRRLLLLIDAWDTRSSDFRQWFEEAILLPLIQHEQLVAVITSQAPLRLRTYTVRRRMKAIGLSRLSREATFAQTGHDAATNHRVFALTGGYPAAVQLVLDALRHAVPPPEQWLRDHTGSLAREIGTMLEQTLCGHLPPHIARLLTHLALFREFDIHTIRHITRLFLPDLIDYGTSSLVQELQQTGAIHWNNSLRAYQIDAAVRPLIARDIAYNAPETYQHVHLVAVEYYQELIRNVPAHRVTYLLEYIYHRLCLDTVPTLQYSNVQQDFTAFLEQHYTAQHMTHHERDILHSLRQRLDQDDEIHTQLAQFGVPVSVLTEPITRMITAAQSDDTAHDDRPISW
jgi:hypothetical protein